MCRKTRGTGACRSNKNPAQIIWGSCPTFSDIILLFSVPRLVIFSTSLNLRISRQRHEGLHWVSHSLYSPSPGFFPLVPLAGGIYRKPGEVLLVFTSSSVHVQGAVYWEAKRPRGHCCQSMIEVSEAAEWPPPPPLGSGSVLAKPLFKQVLSQFSNQQSKQSASGRQPAPLGVTVLREQGFLYLWSQLHQLYQP